MGLKLSYQSADLSQSKNLFQVDVGPSYLFHTFVTSNYLFRANSALEYFLKNIPPPPDIEWYPPSWRIKLLDEHRLRRWIQIMI